MTLALNPPRVIVPVLQAYNNGFQLQKIPAI